MKTDRDIYKGYHSQEIDGFTVTLKFIDEDCDPADMEYEEDILQSIYSGDLTWLVAHVQAYKCGIELGSAYLGGICYEWNKLQDVIIDIFPDMAIDAISEAKDKLIELQAA